MADIEKQNSLIPLSQAVETIKTAILQGQYEALKGTNRIQLAVYFAIGKYLSNNTRRPPYGAGALKAISDQLLRELPGLRGYSATNLKYMRLFYEAWQMLDVDSSVATDNSQSTIAIAESSQESSVVTDELQVADNKIDIYFRRHAGRCSQSITRYRGIETSTQSRDRERKNRSNIVR